VSSGLPSAMVAAALVRRVNDAGGLAVIRAKGDTQAGAILVVAVDRSATPKLWERGIGPAGHIVLIDTTPADSAPAAIEDYWRRRRRNDPDLWVVELDIPSAERFAAETMLDR